MKSGPLHLRLSAPIAPDALLPVDPGWALAIAEAMLEQPRMSNHARGLWGYYGETKDDGRPLTVQATGIGGPSAAIVLEELAGLGVNRVIGLGTCGAFDGNLGLGDLLVAEGTIRGPELTSADPGLSAALCAEGIPATRVASSDLFYDPDLERKARAWSEAGAIAVGMESATLFELGGRLGVAVAALLAVSDLLGHGTRERIEDEPLAEAGVRMGRIAASALARS